jgi:hypothetical protein
MVASVYGPLPEIDLTGLELDLGFGLGIFDLGLELDQTSYDLEMRGELPEGVEFSSWSGYERRLAGRFRADILEERTWVELVGEARRFEDEDPAKSLWTPYDTRELIGRARVGVTDEVAVLADVRRITYRDVEQPEVSGDRASGAGREDETFYTPYVAVSYSPRENIELRLGYGVDPRNYIDTPVEGRPDGRERWRDEHIWSHGGVDSPAAVIEAEKALEDATTIGLMAVISF